MAGLIVVDASAFYELLRGTRQGVRVAGRLLDADIATAPHLIDVEVLTAIRNDERSGDLDATAAELAVQDLQTWPVERYPHQPFLSRAWELRHSVRTTDALYVALAEVLHATLLTTDARLARAHGPRCTIELPR